MKFTVRHRDRMNAGASRVVIETLECRQLLSAGTVRVVSYNIEDDINGNTTPLPGLYQVLEGIGEEKVQGNVRPIDILGLEETTSNSVTVAPIVTALNSYYNGAAVYAQSSYQATQSGSNSDGNGPNALVYNTSALNLVASVGVGTPGGSGNGEYRQVVRYEFQPVGDTGSTGIFYIYVSHMKSGTTSADATARGKEATIIRNDEATLPTGSSVLYTGDLNSNPPEAEFTNFTATGPGQAYDQVGFSTSVQYYSESSTDIRYRDDYELLTQNVLNDTGNLNYISGSFHVFANNGSTPSGGSVNSGSDTALNSDLVQDGGTFISASSLYGYLTTASDHLPVVADYTLGAVSGSPTIGSFSASPSTVPAGTSTTLTASNVVETGGSGTITGVNFYRESNGTSGLQIGSDTLVGSGALSGSNWTITTSTSGFAPGSYTYYAVATDSLGDSSAASSTSLTVTSSPAIASLSLNPTSVVSGNPFSVTANAVTDIGSAVNAVTFYEESNGIVGLQTGAGGDTVLGTGTQSGSNWTLSNISTTGLLAGSYNIYGVASDGAGARSATAVAALTVTPGQPTIGSLTANPASVTAGTIFTLTAGNVTEAGGSIASVAFYRESNGTSGLQIGSDTFVGNGAQSGSTWTLSNISTTGLAPNSYTYYAVAVDSTNVSSSAAATTLTVVPPPVPLVDISILGSTNPAGPFSSSINVTPGATVFFEVVGQIAPVGSSENGKTITSLTAHPIATPTPTGYDGIGSLAFSLSETGAFTATFGTANLATNPATGDDWSKGTGASGGTPSGSSITGVRPIQAPGVFAAAQAPESIISGPVTIASQAVVGSTASITGAYIVSSNGGFAFNSNPNTGLGATKVVIADGDPSGYVAFSPLNISIAAGFPSWLSDPGGNDTWNAGSHTLNVVEASTIIADPGSDHPNIVASVPAAQLKIQPATVGFVNVGNIALSGGAGIDVVSVGASRTHFNHNTLVVDSIGGSVPTISIDSSSKLNVEDNDLIVQNGGDADYNGVGGIYALAYEGRGGAAAAGAGNGTWTGNGITSSAAAADDASQGFEHTQLVVAVNGEIANGSYNTWQAGTQTLNLGANDIIVKYTYTGDNTLDGAVDNNSAGIAQLFFGSSGDPSLMTEGDLGYEGSVSNNDAGIFQLVFGNGTVGGSGAIPTIANGNALGGAAANAQL